MVRTAHVAIRLARYVATVPAIAYRTTRDIERWVEWLSRKPSANVATELSTLRSNEQWQWAMERLSEFAASLDRVGLRPRLFSIGPSVPGRLRDLRATWPYDLTIASRWLWHKSKARRLIAPDGIERHEVHCPQMAIQTVLDQNIATMEEQVSAAEGATDRLFSAG
jgi:hypothetical protein